MLDSKKRFSKTAKLYDKYRPSYPEELVKWIIKTTKIKPQSKLADIGCGTGISTRLFSNKAFCLIGIDPNTEMLDIAIKKGGALYQKGEATNTGLQAKSVNLITVAQAFHWFDLQPTFKEFRRILKPNGWCCAFWNIRQNSEFLEKYDLLIKQLSKDYSKTPKASETVQKIRNSKTIGSLKEKKFQYVQKFNFEGLIGRAYSASYIAHGVKNKNLFKKNLKHLFNTFQKKNQVKFRYKTIAICWQFLN